MTYAPDDSPSWAHYELGKKLNNWGRWGEDDEIGTLNFVTAAKRRQAASLVKTGKVFDLGMPFDADGPQSSDTGGGRVNPVHVMTLTPQDHWDSDDTLIVADDMITMFLQCATQWDGLTHVGYDGMFYNGVPAACVSTRTGATRNSFCKSSDRLITRGVLLDIARLKEVDRLPDSYEITSADLAAAEKQQGIAVEAGDVVCVRTGEYRYFLEGNRARFKGDSAGLGLDATQWIFDHSIAALAVDNWACEAMPSPVEGVLVPFHQVAIRDMGLLIGEMFDFERLSDDCNQDGVWEFMFSGTGLKITGSVGSPVTPMALK